MYIHWIEICYLKTLNAYLPCRTWSINTIKFNFLLPNPYSQSYGFFSTHVWMWELVHKKRLSTKWLMLLNYGVGEDSLRVAWTARRSNQSIMKGNQPWIFIGRTDAEAEAPILWPPDAESTHWKRPRCWKRLKAGGEGDDRGWDGWMTSSTQWTWVWTNCRRWWRTGKPGVLQSMGSQRAGHDWVTEQQQLPNHDLSADFCINI